MANPTPLRSLLIVGTAYDGPVGLPIASPVGNIAPTLSLYGESRVESFTMTPTTTGTTLSTEPLAQSIKYFYATSGILQEVALNQLIVSGSILLFDTPAIVTSVNGWFQYTSRDTITNASLTEALKEANKQALLTAPEDGLIYTMRVAGSGSIAATGALGPLHVYSLYPGEASNNWSIELTEEYLAFYSPKNSSAPRLWKYAIVPPTGFSSRRNKTYYKTIGELQSALQLDKIAGNFPFEVTIDLPLATPCTELIDWAGETVLSGGVTIVPAVNDYVNLLDSLPLETYDVIAVPGLSGRELFPYTSNLFQEHVGYPFSIVCSTSGGSVNVSSIGQDLWQSDRLHLAAGTVSSLYSSFRPYTTFLATVLSSRQAMSGLGTRQRIAQPPTQKLTITELEQLSEEGVCVVTDTPNGPVLYLGRSTKKNKNSSSISCYRGVCRTLIPALYKTIGTTAERAHRLAEQAVAQSFQEAIARGCPILDYTAEVSVFQEELTIKLDMRIAGQIETIQAIISRSSR